MKKKIEISALNKYCVKNLQTIVGGGSRAVANLTASVSEKTSDMKVEIAIEKVERA